MWGIDCRGSIFFLLHWPVVLLRSLFCFEFFSFYFMKTLFDLIWFLFLYTTRLAWWLSMVFLLILITCYQLKSYKSTHVLVELIKQLATVIMYPFVIAFYTLIYNKDDFFRQKKGISNFNHRKFNISTNFAFEFRLKDVWHTYTYSIWAISCQQFMIQLRWQIYTFLITLIVSFCYTTRINWNHFKL